MKWLIGLLLLFPFFVQATEIKQDRARMEKLTRGLAHGNAIELRALEIRARIYEPSVIYILDRSKLEVEYGEKETQFTPRIEKPIVENRF